MLCQVLTRQNVAIKYLQEDSIENSALPYFNVFLTSMNKYSEIYLLWFLGPQVTDFLRVKTLENDCYTDVSDADTEDEE